LQNNSPINSQHQDEMTSVSSLVVPNTYTSLVSDIEFGSKLLSMFGSFDYQEDKDVSLKDAAISIRKLIQDLDDCKSELAEESTKFLGGLLKSIITEDKITSIQADILRRGIKDLLEQNGELTPGMKKAIGDTAFRYQCPECRFMFPKYPGRYPSTCPICQSPVEKGQFSHLNAYHKMNNVVDSCDFVVCPSCGFIEEDFEAKKHINMDCPLCESKLEIRSSINSIKSGLLELFHSSTYFSNYGKHFEGLVTLSENLKIPIRSNNIFIELLENQEQDFRVLFSDLYEYALTSNTELESEIIEKFSDLTENKVKSIFEDIDPFTLTCIYPLVYDLCKITGSKISESLGSRIRPLVYILYEAIESIKPDIFVLPESDRNKFSKFIDEMFSKHPNPVDLHQDYTIEHAENFARQLIGEKALSSIRVEVSKRHDLFKRVQSLKIENFNMDKALKAYSSCLSRVLIEHEKERSFGLDLLRSIVLENMNDMLSGDHTKAINFIKGVFLFKNQRV
jgi:rubrerythrin